MAAEQELPAGRAPPPARDDGEPLDDLAAKNPNVGSEFLSTDPLEIFLLRIKLSAYLGVALAMPFLLWQLWSFIAPGLYQNERRYAATFVASDVNTDVGVIKIDGVRDLPVLEFGDSSKLAVGQQVVAVGSPLGLSAAELAACLAAPETQAAIDADVALYGRMEARGLPTTYVGRRLVVAYNPERIRDALRREAAGDDVSLPLPWLFVALFGAAAVALLVGGRDRSRGAADQGGAAPSSSSPERS